MSVVRGYLAEVRVFPMTLLLLSCIVGGLLGVGVNINWYVMSLVLVNAFCYLYVAHLNDTLFDYYYKGEYEPDRKLHNVRLDGRYYLARWGFGAEVPNAPILPKNYYLVAMVVFSAVGFTIMIYLSTVIGFMYSLLAITGLVLALTYSAGVDKLPVVGDIYWQVGVIFALYCGYYSQTMRFDLNIVIMSVPLFIYLLTFKMLDSLPDTVVDDMRNKRTLTVLLHRRGLNISTIRHLCFIPSYVALSMLAVLAPPKVAPGAIAAMIAIAAVHLGLRRDHEGRLSMTLTAIVTALFILYTIISFYI